MFPYPVIRTKVGSAMLRGQDKFAKNLLSGLMIDGRFRQVPEEETTLGRKSATRDAPRCPRQSCLARRDRPACREDSLKGSVERRRR